MLIFHIYILNKDISLNMRLTCLEMDIHVSETHLEGRVYFIACRSGGFKKNTKK